MTDNRTTELREKLREHGIEYEPTKFSTLQTTFTANGVEWVVTERESTGELFVEPRHGLTPEQAVAATLGSGTCVQVLTDYDDGLIPLPTAHCSVCGAEWGFTPKYCHNCGAMVTGTRDERKTVER